MAYAFDVLLFCLCALIANFHGHWSFRIVFSFGVLKMLLIGDETIAGGGYFPMDG